jgi:uncharacterized membrane protein YfcA
MLGFLFTVNLVRGSSKNPSIVNINKCGALDWSIFFGAIITYVAICYINVLRVQYTESIKKLTNIGTHKTDISYSGTSLMKLLGSAIGGGFCGAVGLGGGVAFNPVLIGMGVHPQQTTATGMYMIMFSAFSNALTFWLFGSLNIRYAVWIGLWSGLGIYIFLSIVGAIIKKYNRPSIIVFFLGGVIALSAIVVPAVNTTFLVYSYQ